MISEVMQPTREKVVGGIKIEVPGSVWAPYVTAEQFVTEILPGYQPDIAGAKVMDVGTGSGILAIKAGQMDAGLVVVTDFNPHAAKVVEHNWALNGLDPNKLATVESDRFQSPDLARFLGGVDFIIANPPVQPFLLTDRTSLDRNGNAAAWNEAGAGGREVLDAILFEGPKFVKDGGKIVTSTSTRHGHGQTVETLAGMKDRGEISEWREIVRDPHPLTGAYEQYIPLWRKMQSRDGDTRIWRGEDGTWYHDFIVLEVTK